MGGELTQPNMAGYLVASGPLRQLDASGNVVGSLAQDWSCWFTFGYDNPQVTIEADAICFKPGS